MDNKCAKSGGQSVSTRDLVGLEKNKERRQCDGMHGDQHWVGIQSSRVRYSCGGFFIWLKKEARVL